MIRHACAWTIVAALIGVSAVAARQTPPAAPGVVFSSRVDTVRVDVAVQRDDRTVEGLGAADFEVFDNGVLQQIDLVQFEDAPINVILALDVSGSVRGERMTRLQEAAGGLVRALRPDDAAALIRFTDHLTIPPGFSSDEDVILAGLRQASATGDTALFDAAHAALVLGESGTGRPVVILFSDGSDTASFLTERAVLQTARRTSSVVYAVTLPNAGRTEFLDSLASSSGGRRLEATSQERLSETFTGILDEARRRYLISYTPRGVPAGGWHDLRVRLKRGRADVRARPGYFAADVAPEH
jgi:VWFA-related protein